jgi:ribosomal protein S18 acetylase RimI-like enzyme
MIISYLTKNINKNIQYYDDIGLLVSHQRNYQTPAEVIASEGDGTLLLYIIDNRAIASLRYFDFDTHLYVNLVHTLEEYRGKGIAIALFDHLKSKTIKLEVDINNIPAINLYKKIGFRGCIEGDYIQMTREL